MKDSYLREFPEQEHWKDLTWKEIIHPIPPPSPDQRERRGGERVTREKERYWETDTKGTRTKVKYQNPCSKVGKKVRESWFDDLLLLLAEAQTERESWKIGAKNQEQKMEEMQQDRTAGESHWHLGWPDMSSESLPLQVQRHSILILYLSCWQPLYWFQFWMLHFQTS